MTYQIAKKRTVGANVNSRLLEIGHSQYETGSRMMGQVMQ